MAVQRWAGGKITCLAADTKPTGVPTGSELVETDTRKRYYFDGTNWINQEFPMRKRYRIFKVGTNHFITDIHGKIVQGPSTDVAALVNAQMALMGLPSVWEFVWDADGFTIENPIIFPV